MTTTGALARLRAGNTQAVTDVLAREGALRRAYLVRGTRLSRAPVSSLVAELIGAGRVVETSERVRPHRGGSGRPPVLVRLSAPTGIVAGVDLGHRHVRVVVADRASEVLAEERRVLDVDGLGVAALEVAAAMVREAGQGHEDVRRVLHAAGHQVGRVLADLVTALDPSVVVVGGPLGRAGAVLDGVRAGPRDHADPNVVAGLEVRPGALGERAEVLGAVSFALTRVAQA